MRMLPSIVEPGHPDYDTLVRIRDGIAKTYGSLDQLQEDFPQIIRDAVDFVLDPVRTARTQIQELDKVEKTFVGLKIEHFIRDVLKAPKGIRDLVIDGQDVDIKNTLDRTWMIPPETFGNEDPCLVINSKEADNTCWMGLMLARSAYLNEENRDGKRSVKARAVENILWIVEGVQYPPSRWLPFDMLEFRRLRQDIKGGAKRAAAFFRLNPEIPVHRTIIQALLFDQVDYMKRIRENGGARDLLRKEQIALLTGAYDNGILLKLDREEIDAQESIAVIPENELEYRFLVDQNIIDPK